MSEEWIVRYCSPTLAGLKTGSMFSCAYCCEEELREDIRRLNRRLAPKGVRVIPLQQKNGRALIYFFRPCKLERDLSDRAAAELLRQRGYPEKGAAVCLRQLIQRFDEGGEFPHEVGLFLGYPPEDVRGFIEHKYCGCKCVGNWKVYGDAQKAQEAFSRFDKCTRIYCEQWARGKSIERLTVAG
ncbi:MAG: DUF3793 family protein [Faecalibacterium sp.]